MSEIKSMTKSEFMRRYRELRDDTRDLRGYSAPFDSDIAALVEEAGVEWDPEPTPEPTGDLSKVRAIDAVGDTWRWAPAGWIGSAFTQPWSKVPQPVTVLRPEGDQP